MELSYAFICDYADSSGGKVNALGIGFDEIRVTEFPATHRSLYVVVELRLDRGEFDALNVAVRVVSPSLESLAEIRAEAPIPEPPTEDPESRPLIRLVAAVGALRLPEAGRYRASIEVAGSEVWATQFRVVNIAQNA